MCFTRDRSSGDVYESGGARERPSHVTSRLGLRKDGNKDRDRNRDGDRDETAIEPRISVNLMVMQK